MAVNALTTFTPTIWSARLNANLDKALNLAKSPIVNFDYQGSVNPGNTVKILRPGNFTSAAYDPTATTVAYATPSASSLDLIIDARQYVAFQVDDLDAVQANINLVDRYTERAAYALADKLDQAVAALYTTQGAGVVTLDISTGTPDAYAAFVTAGKNLDLANVPRTGRWAVISPAVYAQLLKDTKFTQASSLGDSVVQSGAVGMVAGFSVFISNNLTDSDGTAVVQRECLYGTNAAITMARALNGAPEAIRLETKFSTGIRMEYAWGLKTIEANALGTLRVKEA